jgi:hypothetical protein
MRVGMAWHGMAWHGMAGIYLLNMNESLEKMINLALT